jgi:ankyrin repeat protein
MDWPGLQDALQRDDLVAFKRLVDTQEKAVMSNTEDFGNLPIHCICKYGTDNAAFIHWIVETYDCIELLNAVRSTAMHVAPYYGRPNCTRALLQHKAVFITANIHDMTPLGYALWLQHLSIARMLLDVGATIGDCGTSAPAWAEAFLQSRHRAHMACIALIGVRKFNRSLVMCSCPRDVVKLIAKHVWLTRTQDEWGTYKVDAVPAPPHSASWGFK